MIPLTEIFESIGQTDANAQMIMESFDLNISDMVGFSKNQKHVIIKDNDNMIYCDIDPTTRKRVHDFLRSF